MKVKPSKLQSLTIKLEIPILGGHLAGQRACLKILDFKLLLIKKDFTNLGQNDLIKKLSK